MPPGFSSRVCSASLLLRPWLPEGVEGARGTCSARPELFLLPDCHHCTLGKRGGPRRALGFPLWEGGGSLESPRVEQAEGPTCAFSDSTYCKQYLSFRIPHLPQRANGVHRARPGGTGVVEAAVPLPSPPEGWFSAEWTHFAAILVTVLKSAALRRGRPQDPLVESCSKV